MEINNEVPEYLLWEYPFLKGTPREIWGRFWQFCGQFIRSRLVEAEVNGQNG